MATKWTKKAVLQKVKGLSEAERNAVVCALLGHSRIQSVCVGYVSCARCEATIGDKLGGAFDTEESVVVGHNCAKCRANFKALPWTDKLFTPDPFAEAL